MLQVIFLLNALRCAVERRRFLKRSSIPIETIEVHGRLQYTIEVRDVRRMYLYNKATLYHLIGLLDATKPEENKFAIERLRELCEEGMHYVARAEADGKSVGLTELDEATINCFADVIEDLQRLPSVTRPAA